MLSNLDPNVPAPRFMYVDDEKWRPEDSAYNRTHQSKMQVCDSANAGSMGFPEHFYMMSPLNALGNISQYIPQASKRLWNRDGGRALASMLEMAGYNQSSRRFHNNFFEQSVSPFLGQHPRAAGASRQWKSFMTDDHTPIELSFSWSTSSPTPDVRYSIEPISFSAGSSSDRFNSHSGPDMVTRLARQYRTVDRQWFDHFNHELTVAHPETLSPELLSKAGHSSQIFLAYDLSNNADLVLKVYFVPEMKALQVRQSKSALVENAVKKLYPTLPSMKEPCDAMFNFFHESSSTLGLETEIVAIDCVSPEDARIKVYVRSRQTSFDSVKRIITMDGAIKYSEKGMDALLELWHSLLAPDTSYPTSEPLPERGHRTAGNLYYFEIRPGRPLPRPKIYMPVKHYGGNDLKAAKAVSGFLSARGKGLVDSDFLGAAQRLCSHRKLQDGLGFQTYVSCAIEKDTLAMTSYLNPEAYHPGRSQRFSALL